MFVRPCSFFKNKKIVFIDKEKLSLHNFFDAKNFNIVADKILKIGRKSAFLWTAVGTHLAKHGFKTLQGGSKVSLGLSPLRFRIRVRISH